MRLNKLQRFEAIRAMANVFEFPRDKKGKWGSYFRNNNAVTLELACGKGEYALALAEKEPQKNYIGLDIKGNRIYVGARIALEKKIMNVVFVRAFIDHLTDYFSFGEIGEIWITFPDPYLKLSKIKKRLTHPRFLRLYARIIKKESPIHLKTDSLDLYDFTKKIIALYRLNLIKDFCYTVNDKPTENEDGKIYIPTHYEKQNVSGSRKNFYLQFRLTDSVFDTRLDVRLKSLLYPFRNTDAGPRAVE